MIALTGEISYQLTIADHQEQAATYKTKGLINILKTCVHEVKSSNVWLYLMPATTATPWETPTSLKDQKVIIYSAYSQSDSRV